MARNRIHNWHDRLRAQVTERMWAEYLGEVLSMDLAEKLSEPLDDPQFDDLSRADKQKNREVW